MSKYDLYDRVSGSIIAGTLGDSIGGVTEMMHYKTIERVFNRVDGPRPTGSDPSTARFDPGLEAGRYTDDTRLKFFLVDAIAAHDDVLTADTFGAYMKNNLTGWFFTPVVNAYHKMWTNGVRPREAGRGNMASNSTAMAITPIGIINACDPAGAARNTYDVASVIHESYALDAAVSIACAVAEALKPDSSVDSVVAAPAKYLDQSSEIPALIERAVAIAKATANFEEFRENFYDTMTLEWPQTDLTDTGGTPEGFYTTAEPRETIPAVFGIFVASGGDPREAVLNAANFGRDSDTIGSMVGGIAGALSGTSSIPKEWIEIVDNANDAPMSHYVDKIFESLTAHRKRQLDIIAGS